MQYQMDMMKLRELRELKELRELMAERLGLDVERKVA